MRTASAVLTVALLGSAFTVLFSLQTPDTFAVRSQCSDGLDNDNNGKTDYPQDPQCDNIDDDYEGISSNGNFITITDDKDTVSPGGNLVYRITLRQQRETSRNVNVLVNVPHQASIISASDGGSIGTDTVRWTNVSVYKNDTRVLTINVNIKSDAVPGQYMVVRALVDGTEATDTTLVENYVPPQGERFRISVTDNKEYILPGENDTYTVKVKNIADVTQTTDVNLALPIEAYYVSASDGGVRNSYNVVWKNVVLAPNEEKSFNATFQVDPVTKDKRILRAKAYAGTVNAFDQTVVRIGLPYNSITSSITDNRSSASVGQILTYTVKVANKSGTLGTDVSVDAALPMYGEFVSADEGGSWDGSNVRWLILQIAPNDTRTLTYKVRVRSDAPDGAELLGSVSADGVTAKDFTTVVDGSSVSSNVLFRKTADRQEAVPGGSIRYTLFVRNTLDHAITDAVILDRFDAQYLSLESSENPRDLASQSGNQMTWSVPVLQPGESWQTSYVLSVAKNAPNAMELNNVATIRGTDLRGLSLTETVTANTSGVLRDFPSTGVGMDAIIGMMLAAGALATTAAHRKLGLFSI